MDVNARRCNNVGSSYPRINKVWFRFSLWRIVFYSFFLFIFFLLLLLSFSYLNMKKSYIRTSLMRQLKDRAWTQVKAQNETEIMCDRKRKFSICARKWQNKSEWSVRARQRYVVIIGSILCDEGARHDTFQWVNERVKEIKSGRTGWFKLLYILTILLALCLNSLHYSCMVQALLWKMIIVNTMHAKKKYMKCANLMHLSFERTNFRKRNEAVALCTTDNCSCCADLKNDERWGRDANGDKNRASKHSSWIVYFCLCCFTLVYVYFAIVYLICI